MLTSKICISIIATVAVAAVISFPCSASAMTSATSVGFGLPGASGIGMSGSY